RRPHAPGSRARLAVGPLELVASHLPGSHAPSRAVNRAGRGRGNGGVTTPESGPEPRRPLPGTGGGDALCGCRMRARTAFRLRDEQLPGELRNVEDELARAHLA